MSEFAPPPTTPPRTSRRPNLLPVTIAVVGVVILLEVGWFVAHGSKSLLAQWEAKLGVDAAQQGDWRQAEQHFTRALRLQPGLEEANLGLTEVYKQTGRKREALKAFVGVLKLHPSDLSARGTYTQLLDECEQYADEERELRWILRHDPEHAGANNSLAYLLAEQDRELDAALKMAQKAVKASGNSGAIWDTLGWVYYRMHEYKEAEYSLRRALQFEPLTYDAAHYHLGMTYVRMKKDKDAKAELNLVSPKGEFAKLAQDALNKLKAGAPVPEVVKPKDNVKAQ